MLKRTASPWIAALLLAAPAAPAPPMAGEARRVVAFFWHDSPNDEAALLGFRDGLRTAGLPWSVTVVRAGGDPAAAATRLAEIRATAPDLVLALGTKAALLARDAFPDRPVVFTAVTNPVGAGLVPSWAGSGARLAGNSNWLPALELLRAFRATAPHLVHLGVLHDPGNAVSAAEVAEVVAAARERFPDLVIRREPVAASAEVGPAAARLVRAGVQALWIPIDLVVYQQAAAVVAAADPAHVPVLTSAAGPAREAATVAVVPDYHVMGRQAAELARRVLVEGANPGALPVGRLRTFRTVVNLRAAARAGYEVPLPLLAAADEVIR